MKHIQAPLIALSSFLFLLSANATESKSPQLVELYKNSDPGLHESRFVRWRTGKNMVVTKSDEVIAQVEDELLFFNKSGALEKRIDLNKKFSTVDLEVHSAWNPYISLTRAGSLLVPLLTSSKRGTSGFFLTIAEMDLDANILRKFDIPSRNFVSTFAVEHVESLSNGNIVVYFNKNLYLLTPTSQKGIELWTPDPAFENPNVIFGLSKNRDAFFVLEDIHGKALLFDQDGTLVLKRDADPGWREKKLSKFASIRPFTKGEGDWLGAWLTRVEVQSDPNTPPHPASDFLFFAQATSKSLFFDYASGSMRACGKNLYGEAFLHRKNTLVLSDIYDADGNRALCFFKTKGREFRLLKKAVVLANQGTGVDTYMAGRIKAFPLGHHVGVVFESRRKHAIPYLQIMIFDHEGNKKLERFINGAWDSVVDYSGSHFLLYNASDLSPNGLEIRHFKLVK